MKKTNVLVWLILITTCSITPAMADPASDSLGVCLVDSITGKERKQIAQWLFFAMAAHPEIKEFSKVPEESRNSSNEFLAKLVTRLLTENCPSQTKLAVKENGAAAIRGAFELVGRVAMQELMTDKDVTNSVGAYEKYLDKAKIGAVMSEE